MSIRRRNVDSIDETASSVLDDAVFLLGRAYFSYVGLIERVLRENQLAETFAPGMGQIMFALFERDDRIIKEISGRVGLSQSTLTGMLTRMEKNGLIERRRDAIDGRAIRVRLTTRGRELEPKCWEIFHSVREQFRRAMDDSELSQLRVCLGKLHRSLQPIIVEEPTP